MFRHVGVPSLNIHTIKLSPRRTLYAFDQLKQEEEQEAIGHFNDECFVLSCGVRTFPNAKVAANLARDTAVWAYTHLRTKSTYQEDKRLLVHRIFRTTNMALFQKRKETGFDAGIAATLAISIVSDQMLWIGSIGDSRIYIGRAGVLRRVTRNRLSS